MSKEEKSNQGYIFEGKIREYEIRLIELISEMGEIRNQTPIFSLIIGYLIFHGRLTQKQLKYLTGFSIGSISTTLNAMTSVGATEKKMIKGTHTFEYSFGGDLSQILSRTSFFKYEVNTNAIKFVQAKINELNKKENKNKKGNKVLLKKMVDMMNFLSIHKKILDMITKSEIVEKLIKTNIKRG